MQSSFFSPTFGGYVRSNRVVLVEITLRQGRSGAMKRALYANIASNLEKNAGLAPNDVFISTHENGCLDWSVGGGKFATAIAHQVGPGARALAVHRLRRLGVPSHGRDSVAHSRPRAERRCFMSN